MSALPSNYPRRGAEQKRPPRNFRTGQPEAAALGRKPIRGPKMSWRSKAIPAMKPPKTFTSVSQQLARQMATAAERGADKAERDDGHAKRDAQYIKERKRRSGDVVGKIFRRV